MSLKPLGKTAVGGLRADMTIRATGPRLGFINLDMDEPGIRAAADADVSAIAKIVAEAYRHYIPRTGKPPGPMLDDYAARVSEGVVWVVGEGSNIAGVIVLLPRAGVSAPRQYCRR